MLKIIHKNKSKGFIPFFAGSCIGIGMLMLTTAIILLIGFGFFSKESEDTSGGGGSGGTVSLTGVPAGWATIIDGAAQVVDVPPAMIAAIFLTEKHITSFPADIDPSGRENPCVTSYAGAAGPWQLMPNWWRGSDAPLVKNATKYGLTVLPGPPTVYVDMCVYKQAAIGGAYVIKTKMNNAGISGDYCSELTDDNVKEIAERYCGCCTCSGCGKPGKFSYCEFALERFKSVLITPKSSSSGSSGCFGSGGGGGDTS